MEETNRESNEVSILAVPVHTNNGTLKVKSERNIPPATSSGSVTKEITTGSGSFTTTEDKVDIVMQTPVNRRFEDRFYNCSMLILTGI